MDIFHILRWIIEIWSIASIALVAVSVGIATVRAILGHNKAPFHYPEDVPAAEARAAAEGYLHRCLVALDIFMNVVFFCGEQDETMSTHAWRAAVAGKLWGKAMNLWLNGFQSDHGPRAASGDLERSSVRVSILSKALDIK